MATAQQGPFERFREIHIVLPLDSACYTIWPEAEQTQAEWAIGHPLELRPFRWDFLDISCDSQQLKIQPHYDKSTWDTFFIDPTGKVKVTAFGGLFPITLGRQADLLKGIVSVLKILPDKIRKEHPVIAQQIDQIAQHLDRVSIQLRSGAIPTTSVFHVPVKNLGLRDRLLRRFWKRKLN